MLFSDSILDLFSGPNSSLRRRKQIQLKASSTEPLECRMLLTNQAPTLTEIKAQNGTIEGIVQDDQTNGLLEISIDFDQDGLNDFSQIVSEGEKVYIDVSQFIPVNQKADVIIVLSETINNEEDGSVDEISRTITVEAEGPIIKALNFEWITAENSEVSGIITNINDSVGEVSVLWREVGDTAWEVGTQNCEDGLFMFHLAAADGEKDFEFVVSNGGVLGSIARIDNVTGYNGGGMDGEGGDGGSGGDGGFGDGGFGDGDGGDGGFGDGSGFGGGWGRGDDDDGDDDDSFWGSYF